MQFIGDFYSPKEVAKAEVLYWPLDSFSLIASKAAMVSLTSSIEWTAVGINLKMIIPLGMTG